MTADILKALGAYRNVRLYVAALMFSLAGVIFPQFFHAVPMGGPTWLPIYFFTIVASIAGGWQTGLLTAILVPLSSHIFFGMPAAAVLAPVMIKSVLIAVAAGVTYKVPGRYIFFRILAVIAIYQTVGTLAEWLIAGDLHLALQDFRIGIPGMALQAAGGWITVRAVRGFMA